MSIVTSFFSTAKDLPHFWDEISDCYFQTREFLTHVEVYNPCNQRYYLLTEDEKPVAGACVYTIAIDLLTFINVKSPVKMQVIGISATISPPGIFGKSEYITVLLKEIFQKEKGLILGMNLLPQIDCGPAIVMRTMPTIQLTHNFSTWQEYEDALRSDYRRRLTKVTGTFKDIETRKGNCSRFDAAFHDLYLEILKRTNTPLETLSLDFFRNLPDSFLLTSYHYQADILAWHITKTDGHVLYFFFGGTNYQLNEQYNAYFNNLIGILKEAIDLGCSMIEYGQTAEIPKTRLGGIPLELNLFLYHRNKALNILLGIMKNVLQYRRKIPVVHVFKSLDPN